MITGWTEKAKDSAFNRRKADLRLSRTRIPVKALLPGNNNSSAFDRAVGAGAVDSSSQHFAIPQGPRAFPAEPPMPTQRTFQSQTPPPAPAQQMVEINPDRRIVKQALTPDEVEALALYDGQTNSYNLRYLMSRLEYEVQRAHTFGRDVMVMVVAVDNFQSIGLDFGAMALDRVLETVCLILRNGLRPIDLVGRLSEGRFAVVCPEISNEDVTTLAQIVSQACGAVEIKHQWQSMKFTVSIGIAKLSDEVNDSESLLAFADLCADDASGSGGNAICFEG